MRTRSRKFCVRVGWSVALGALLCAHQVVAADQEPAWPCRTLQLPARPDRGKPPVISALGLQAGGRLVAMAGDDHVIYLWDLASGQEPRRLVGHEDWVHAVAFSPDGKTLASAGLDRQVIFWDVDSGRRRCVLSGPRAAVVRLAWSHDGTRLAVTGFENRLRIYDAARQGLIRELDGPGADLRAAAFSHDDGLLAAGGRNGVIRVWDARDFHQVQEYAAHQRRIRDLIFSPESRQIVSVGEDQKIHVRDLATGAGDDLPPRPAKCLSLAFFGPHRLAVGGSDNLVRLWDLSTREEIGQLTGHDGSVAALASDHRVLISSGYDTTARIWTIQDRVAGHPARTGEVKK